MTYEFVLDTRYATSLFSRKHIPVMKSIQPPIQYVPPLFPGAERPERKANHSPASSAEVKIEWRHTSTPPGYIHSCCAQAQIYLLLLEWSHQDGRERERQGM
jgi:hypothetical protein